MRIIVHGRLEQVAAITPGRLVIEVASVSEPYENRKGTPRLYRVYLEGDIVPAAAAGSADAGSSTTVRRSDQRQGGWTEEEERLNRARLLPGYLFSSVKPDVLRPVANERLHCPGCGRGVAITRQGRWPRHKTDLPHLTNQWCPASGHPASPPQIEGGGR